MKNVLISFLCLFCWLGSPESTPAQTPTTDKPEFTPTVDTSGLKKEEPKTPKEPEKKGPALRASEVYRTRTARTEVELQSLINELYRIIDYADDDDPEKPKYYGNLALLYWEKAESYYIQAYSNQSDEALIAARAAKDDAKVAELEAKRQALLDAQQEWRRKAIRVYMDIEEKYADYPKIDMVLFYLGISLNQVGEYDQAFQYFKKLVTQFPASSYIPDGLVNLGEYYFDQAQFTTAIEFYKRVEKFAESRVYSYAIYKQAWCHYNLQEYNESFKKFIEVINYQDQMEAKGLQPKLLLKDQALEDIVLAYSHIGTEKQALDFFKKLAPANFLSLTARLARLYLETNDNAKAVYLFKLLITQQPESKEVLGYQRLILAAVDADGKKDKIGEEVDQLASTYETFCKTYPDVAEKERGAIESLFFGMALRFHTEHQSTKEKAALKLAQQLYGHYLKLFPQAAGRYNTLRNHAVLLYQLKEYEKAAIAYEELLAMEPEGIYAKEASYTALLCYYKMLDFSQPAKVRAEEDDLTPVELTGFETKFIAACDRLVKQGSDDPEEIIQAIYTPARVLYNKNHFDESAKRLSTFLDTYPKSDTAPEAARLLLSSLALNKDIQGLNAWADKIFAMPDLAKGEILVLIQRIRNEAKFNRCFEFEFRKEFESAAECFVEYSRLFPNSNLVDKAYYNAGNNYQKARKYEQALKVNEYLYNCCSKTSKHGPRALYNIALTYQSAGVYELAAQYFEEFVKRHPREGMAEQAIFRAASLRRALGQYDMTAADYEIIFKMYKKDDRIPRLALDIGVMYSNQQKYAQAEAQFRKFIKTYAKTVPPSLLMEAHRDLGEALMAQRKYEDARKSFVDVVKVLESVPKGDWKTLTPSAVNAVAWAYFNLGHDLFDQAAKIKYTRKNLDEATQQKLALVATGEKYFDTVKKLNIPYWTVLSFYRMGAALEKFADDLEQSPVPSGMDANEEMDYRVNLARFTEKYRADAAAAYEACLEEARKARIFNEFTEKAETRLAEQGLLSAGMSEYRVRPDNLDLGDVMPLYKGREVKVFQSETATPESGATPPESKQPQPPAPEEPKKDDQTPTNGGDSK